MCILLCSDSIVSFTKYLYFATDTRSVQCACARFVANNVRCAADLFKIPFYLEGYSVNGLLSLKFYACDNATRYSLVFFSRSIHFDNEPDPEYAKRNTMFSNRSTPRCGTRIWSKVGRWLGFKVRILPFRFVWWGPRHTMRMSTTAVAETAGHMVQKSDFLSGARAREKDRYNESLGEWEYKHT